MGSSSDEKSELHCLLDEIDLQNDKLDELKNKCNEKTLALSSMSKERDELHLSFYEEARKLQCRAREHVKFLDEQELLNNVVVVNKNKRLDSWGIELENKERRLDSWRIELENKEKRLDCWRIELENKEKGLDFFREELKNREAISKLEGQKPEEEKQKAISKFERQKPEEQKQKVKPDIGGIKYKKNINFYAKSLGKKSLPVFKFELI